jgi:hypothetical protein
VRSSGRSCGREVTFQSRCYEVVSREVFRPRTERSSSRRHAGGGSARDSLSLPCYSASHSPEPTLASEGEATKYRLYRSSSCLGGWKGEATKYRLYRSSFSRLAPTSCLTRLLLPPRPHRSENIETKTFVLYGVFSTPALWRVLYARVFGGCILKRRARQDDDLPGSPVLNDRIILFRNNIYPFGPSILLSFAIVI